MSIGPPRELDDSLRIQAICIDLDIPFDMDFYILLHNFVKEHDPERILGAALFDEQNRQYAESLLGSIKTSQCTAKNMHALANEFSGEWNAKKPLVQLSYMFSDPKEREARLAIYQERILPKMNEYDWYEVYKAIAKKEGIDAEEDETEDLEDIQDTETEDLEKRKGNETEYLGDLLD